MQRTAVALDAELRHRLLQPMLQLRRYEQIRIVSRLKECESALDSLRRRQDAGVFDPERHYTLTSLRDLVGFRVLVFPRHRVEQVRELLKPLLADWASDPVRGIPPEGEPLALKYHGFCDASSRITAEVQIVSSLIGSFWEVEHSAMYKASPNLQGVMGSPRMRDRYRNVLVALRDFESEFESLIREAAEIENS